MKHWKLEDDILRDQLNSYRYYEGLYQNWPHILQNSSTFMKTSKYGILYGTYW